jgi:signal peptidase I
MKPEKQYPPVGSPPADSPVHIPATGARRPSTWRHLAPPEPAPSPAPPGSRQGDVLLEILDWLRYILSAILIGLLLVIFVIQRNAVMGDSMVPTLRQNDQVLVEKVSKLWHGIDYGDIITIRTSGLPQHDEGPNIIKRVIGLPGDTIEIKDGGVYRNGQYLLESYLPPETVTEIRDPAYAKVTLGPGEYYVLGDNRAVSLDSRSIGPIPQSHIIGEVLLRFYPWQAFGRP